MEDMTQDKKSLSRTRAKRSRLGQVVVEMMLILPVFLTMVFTIMEVGYIAFWVILLNHATYECARIGAMKAIDPTGNGPIQVTPIMKNVMDQALPGASVEGNAEPTLVDPQSGAMNHDLVVHGAYDVRLIFPISSRMFSKPPGSGIRRVEALVRMPIEMPQKS